MIFGHTSFTDDIPREKIQCQHPWASHHVTHSMYSRFAGQKLPRAKKTWYYPTIHRAHQTENQSPFVKCTWSDQLSILARNSDWPYFDSESEDDVPRFCLRSRSSCCFSIRKYNIYLGINKKTVFNSKHTALRLASLIEERVYLFTFSCISRPWCCTRHIPRVAGWMEIYMSIYANKTHAIVKAAAGAMSVCFCLKVY